MTSLPSHEVVAADDVLRKDHHLSDTTELVQRPGDLILSQSGFGIYQTGHLTAEPQGESTRLGLSSA